MTDFARLKDTFEMAEMLEDYVEGRRLEVGMVNAEDTKSATVVFAFNEDEELIGGYVDV